jgi:hypothetical protein
MADMKTSTKIKQEYLKWKKQQPKSDRTSFAEYVRAKYPGYKEPKYKKKPVSVAEHRRLSAKSYEEATGRRYGSTKRK